MDSKAFYPAAVPVHALGPEDRRMRPSRIHLRYSTELAQAITDRYQAGESLCSISKDDEMPPYSEMLRWAKENECFRDLLEGARKTRGLDFEERAIEAAAEVHDKDDVPAARLKFDAYKWGAEVSDPARYGKKTTLTGDAGNPLQFIISTGFPEPNAAQQPPKLQSDGLIDPVTETVIQALPETAAEPQEPESCA